MLVCARNFLVYAGQVSYVRLKLDKFLMLEKFITLYKFLTLDIVFELSKFLMLDKFTLDKVLH